MKRITRMLFLIVVIIALATPSAAFAQDVTPDPTEVVTDVPVEVPTEVVTEDPPQETAAPEVVETQLPAEEDVVAEVVETLVEENAMLVDENGDPISLVSTEAAEALAAADPWFVPNPAEPTVVVAFQTDCTGWVPPAGYTGVCYDQMDLDHDGAYDDGPITNAIQYAIDEAAAGTTIHLTGSFTNTVNITKDITLDGGDADDTIIYAPMNLTGNQVGDYFGTIMVSGGANVTIQNITINGETNEETTPNNYLIAGILVHNASVTVMNSHIVNFKDSGDDLGVGIIVYGSNEDATIYLYNNEFVNNDVAVFARGTNKSGSSNDYDAVIYGDHNLFAGNHDNVRLDDDDYAFNYLTHSGYDGDHDDDGIPDYRDNCKYDANFDQANNDGDSRGDACDSDDDNDGVKDEDWVWICIPHIYCPGWVKIVDNCQFTYNPSQTDSDHDGLGDACDMANQTITFAQPATPQIYGDTFDVAASASSGLDVSLAAAGGCSGSGVNTATITMISSTLDCTITATQAGNTAYNPAPAVVRTVAAAKRPLTIAADPASKIWTTPVDPAFTYAITAGNLVFGDLLAGALARDPGEAPGTYPITQGTLDNANYAITFVGSIFTISMTSGQTDLDLDGIKDAVDNCVSTPNPDQKDADGDGIGDACDSTPNGPLGQLLVPVTGGAGFFTKFNCGSNTILRLPSSDFVMASSEFCNFDGELVEEIKDVLPEELPAGKEYSFGMMLTVLDGLTPVKYVEDPGRLTYSFRIPEELRDADLTVYFWDETLKLGVGDWVELPVYAENDDGTPVETSLHPDDVAELRIVLEGTRKTDLNRVEFVTNFPGLFVLAVK